jgi:hypothetical protein
MLQAVMPNTTYLIRADSFRYCRHSRHHDFCLERDNALVASAFFFKDMKTHACVPAARIAPEDMSSLAYRAVVPRERAQGKPGASRTHGLVCKMENTRVSHHRYAECPAFPAQWFYGLLRALPGDRAFLPPSSRRYLCAT